MRVTIPTIAAAISLTVFACSESPSSTKTDRPGCQSSGEEIGISGLFICADAPSDKPNLQKLKTECEEEGDTWVDACPSGEKIVCIDDEDEDFEDVLIKIYVNDFSCGDFGLKKADGSTDIVPMGGACGPFEFDLYPGTTLSACVEFPELSTALLRVSCASEGWSFVTECPSNADLVCYNPEENMIPHYYGEAIRQFTCSQLGMEDL
jgi:hypothetical protein